MSSAHHEIDSVEKRLVKLEKAHEALVKELRAELRAQHHGQAIGIPSRCEELSDNERDRVARSLFEILPDKPALRYAIERDLGISAY